MNWKGILKAIDEYSCLRVLNGKLLASDGSYIKGNNISEVKTTPDLMFVRDGGKIIFKGTCTIDKIELSFANAKEAFPSPKHIDIEHVKMIQREGLVDNQVRINRRPMIPVVVPPKIIPNPVVPVINAFTYLSSSSNKPATKALIIQGNSRCDCVDRYISLYYDSFDEIIISSYPSDYLSALQDRKLDKLKIVYNDKQCNGPYNSQNLYLQVASTLAGLLESKSEYCLKVRGDDFYSNLNRYNFNTDKFFCNNTFFCKDIKYQVSDHVIGMGRDYFVRTMQMVLDKCVRHTVRDGPGGPWWPAEAVIFMGYLAVISGNINLPWNELIAKHIDISYIEDTEPLRISFNSIGVVYNSAHEYYTAPSVAPFNIIKR